MKMTGKNAYFTVEAAMVLPIVISAMLTGIYLFCFQYDRCLMEQDIAGLALWGSALTSEYGEDTEKIAQELKNRAGQIDRSIYAAWKFTAVDIRLEENEILLTGRGELKFPVPGWNFLKGNNLWEARVDIKKKRLSPVFVIRQYRKLKKAASSGS